MDYLKSLGVKRAAEVKRDADVGVAKSTAESGIKVIESVFLSHQTFTMYMIAKTTLCVLGEEQCLRKIIG